MGVLHDGVRPHLPGSQCHRCHRLRRDDGSPGGQGITAHASDTRAKAVEDLQHTLGEGPGVAASTSGAEVLVPDLRDVRDVRDASLTQWPTFAREVLSLGVQAAFAFPLLIGTSRLGALSLYRAEAGALSLDDVSIGRVTADAVGSRLAGNDLPKARSRRIPCGSTRRPGW